MTTQHLIHPDTGCAAPVVLTTTPGAVHLGTETFRTWDTIARMLEEMGCSERQAHRLAQQLLPNLIAEEGVDRCECGCKYWEGDRCVDCGAPVVEEMAR